MTRSVVAVLLVVGLMPATPPPFSWRALLVSLATFGVLSALAMVGGDLLPPLAHHTSLEAARRDALLPGLTASHCALSARVLGLLWSRRCSGPSGTAVLGPWASGWWRPGCSWPARSCTTSSGRRSSAGC
jgi:hypothetical protein